MGNDALAGRYHDGAFFEHESVPVSLTAPQTIDVGEIVLDFAASIGGVVVDDENEPVAGAIIVVNIDDPLVDPIVDGLALTQADDGTWENTIKPLATTLTDENGLYEVTGLNPETYSVVAVELPVLGPNISVSNVANAEVSSAGCSVAGVDLTVTRPQQTMNAHNGVMQAKGTRSQVEQAADLVALVAPEIDQAEPALVGEGEWLVSGEFATVVIDDSGDEPMIKSVDQGGTGIRLGLPLEADLAEAEVTNSGDLVFVDEGSAGLDVVVQADDEGAVRVQTVINTPDAPHVHTYALTLPSRAAADVQADGSVVVTSLDGATIHGGVAPPWAVDASGVRQKTWFALENNMLIQTVQPRLDAAYPIVADPFLGRELISKAWPSYTRGKGVAYHATMTGWGRTFALTGLIGTTGPVIWTTHGWNEMVKKQGQITNPRVHGLTARTSMRQQWNCHAFVIVRLALRSGSGINVEAWRKQNNFWINGIIQHQCNW